MEISPQEFVELTNIITESSNKAFDRGVDAEKERVKPDNFFEAILEYAKQSKTLINYHKSTGKLDGCNWIQIKPTRSGSEDVTYVEISFEDNLNEIHYIGASITEP